MGRVRRSRPWRLAGRVWRRMAGPAGPGAAGREGDAGLDFDAAWYRARYPDVAASGIDPLAHYLAQGRIEGRLARGRGQALSAWREPAVAPYAAWLAVNRLSRADVAELREALGACAGRLPRMSLAVALRDPDPGAFAGMVASVIAQIHGDWELCLVDDGSMAPHVAPMLADVAARDPRIRVGRLAHPEGPGAAANAAVALATGDVVAFLDQDGRIAPDCLAELALHYAEHPDADIVYSDEDEIDDAGRRQAPRFKPDWSPVLLLSSMYVGHMLSLRRALFLALGGFRPAFDGAQHHDLALRAAERARRIGHVPRVLHHRRAGAGPLPCAALEAGRRAVAAAVERRGIDAAAVVAGEDGVYGLAFPDDGPPVTIVVPTRNRPDLVAGCLESLSRTTYRNVDVLVVDNGSDDPATLACLEGLAARPGTRVVRIPSPGGRFSFANLNNEAVRRHVTADYVLFLNDDTRVTAPRWLSQMMGYARMPGVGVVGARLSYGDGTLQHAGIVHGCGPGLVGHPFRHARPGDGGSMGLIRASRECAAVTGACLLTARALFGQLRGFDEEHFAVAYNDIDFGYRAARAGLRCIYCASAELVHLEGQSRTPGVTPRELAHFRRLYGGWRDPWYNRNLALDERVAPATVRPAARRRRPIAALVVTPALALDDTTLALGDLIHGLLARGVIVAQVVSAADGPFRRALEAMGATVHVRPPPADGAAGFDVAVAAHGAWMREAGAELVIADTIEAFWAVTAATRAGLPAVWRLDESDPRREDFGALPEALRPAAGRAFADAYRVVCGSEAMRRDWSALETRGNFRIIRHGLPPRRDAGGPAWDRAAARRRLGVGEGDIVVTFFGALSERGGPRDLVAALAAMPAGPRRRLRVFLAATAADPGHAEAIGRDIEALPADLAARVTMDGAADPFLHVAAADVAVCASRAESPPRSLLEAVAAGLPVVTTPMPATPEILAEGMNALFFWPGDAAALAGHLVRLAEDGGLRARLGAESRRIAARCPGHDETIADYADALREAVNLDVTPRDP